MYEKKRKLLESRGWPPDLLDKMENNRAAGPGPLELRFLDRAQAELRSVGCSALDFLAAHRGLATIALAKELNRGASAFGLLMVIYAEARRQGVVRETAKDLLIREILNKFPDGWSLVGKMSPPVKLSSWIYDLDRCIRDNRIEEYADAIIRDLTKDHPPPEGWKPQVMNDPVIDEVFDRFWPDEPMRALSC